MAAKNVGTLIKEARTAKKYSQDKLAAEIDGLSAADIGKAERGEKELSQTQLRAIAKVLGITPQKTLLEAPKGGTNTASSSASKAGSAKTAAKASSAKTGTTSKTGSASKTGSTAKTGTASKTGTAAKTTAASKSGTAAKTSSAKKSESEAYSATEKKLIELYRGATSDNKKLATRILKGESLEIGDLLPMLGGGDDGLLGSLLGKLGMKREL